MEEGRKNDLQISEIPTERMGQAPSATKQTEPHLENSAELMVKATAQ